MVLDLSLEEQNILAETLANSHRNLEQQICKTDYKEFRTLLRERERVLESVIQKLNQSSLS